MVTVANTIRRNEIYHFNQRIGDKIYRKSLKTDSPSKSREYVSGIVAYIERCAILGVKVEKQDIDKFIEMLIGNKVNEVVRLGKAVTDPLSNTAKSYFDMWYRQTDESRRAQYHYDSVDFGYMGITPPPRPTVQPYTQWLSTRFESVANYCHLSSFLYKIDEEGQPLEINEDHPIYWEFRFPTQASEWFTHLDSQVSNHAKSIGNAVSKNHSVRARMELTELKTKFADLLPDTPPSVHPIVTEEATSPTFETVWEELETYLQEVAKDSKGTISNKSGAFKDLLPVFRGIQLNKLTFEEVEDAWNTLANSPLLKHREKYGFNGKNAEEWREKRWELVASNEIEFEESDLMQGSTLKDKRAFFSNLFKMALRKKYITVNPLELAQLDTKPLRKRDRVLLPKKYKDAIISDAFDSLENPYSWAILLMAHHGLRNSEVTNLTTSQIIKDADTNIYYINIKQGKTAQAKRKVPIHSKLRKAGFLEFVDSCNDSLFNFESSHLTNYYFKVLRPKFDIPAKTEAGELLNLYSLRHDVITQLVECPPEIKYFLVGHQGNNVTTGYTHDYLVAAQMWINKITY